MQERRPLEGIRVVDFTWVLAGPHATRLLADFGAQVIKVEDRSGRDLARRLPPMVEPAEGPDRSGYFVNLNRNKLSLTVDLQDPRGVEVVKALVAVSDLVIENFRAGVMERLGLGYEALRAVRPDIVYVTMPGMGQEGPWRHFASYGPIVKALSGITYLTGYPDRGPSGMGYSYPDFIGGLCAAFLAMAALHHRRRTGRGQFIDLSQLEAAVNFLGPGLMDWLVNRRPQGRTANRIPGMAWAPHGAYPCRGDDRWCVIVVTSDEEWQALCRVMGQPPWCQDPRFRTAPGRARNQDLLDSLLARWTREQEAEALVERLQSVGVPAAVVENARDLIDADEHLRQRGFYVELEHPEVGRRLHEGTPIRMSATTGGPSTPAPLLGQHADLVLSEVLGWPEEVVNSLIVRGVV